MAGGENKERRTLRDHVIPGAHCQISSITSPLVTVNNFELKPMLICMVQQSYFSGTTKEDLNLHPSIFLEICYILKNNGASSDTICLRLSSFSLKDK